MKSFNENMEVKMQEVLIGYTAGRTILEGSPVCTSVASGQVLKAVSLRDIYLNEMKVSIDKIEAERQLKNSTQSSEFKKMIQYLEVKPEPDGSIELLKICYRLCDKILMLENKVAILENQTKYKGF